MCYVKANVLVGGLDCNGNQVASPPPPKKKHKLFSSYNKQTLYTKYKYKNVERNYVQGVL